MTILVMFQLPFDLVFLKEQALKVWWSGRRWIYPKCFLQNCQSEHNQVMVNKAAVEAIKSLPHMTLNSKKPPFKKNYWKPCQSVPAEVELTSSRVTV